MNAKIGFEMRIFSVPLKNILPVRQVKDPEKRMRRYPTIIASIKVTGLIEPLMVYPQKGKPQKYILVDGHLRRLALTELGIKSADCIIAKDDESFTYNARISRVAPIQEHQMITRAVRNGVKPERIAAALNIPIRKVHERLNLLNGIHEEAVELLKDKNIAPNSIRLLRRVTAFRQLEIAQIMTGANNFTAAYVEAMILATREDQLIKSDSTKKTAKISPEDIARMQQEMESLTSDAKEVEKTYSENMLNFTVMRSYIKKLLDNAKVIRFLSAKHTDIFNEFESIAAIEAF